MRHFSTIIILALTLIFSSASCQKNYLSSDIHLIGTGTHLNGEYRDGEVLILTKPAVITPLRFVFLAEGYTREDMKVGGKFEKDALRACDALFAIEPMSRLRWRCEVRMVCLYSEERGIGVEEPKNTKFGAYVVKEGKTNISWEDAPVQAAFASALRDAPFTERGEAICVLLCNENVYAGTCILSLYEDEDMMPFAVSAVPVYESEKDPIVFERLVWHEVIGHNVGRLIDEYRDIEGLIPDDKKNEILMLQDKGGWDNVTFENGHSWEEFSGREGYERVGCFEGAAGYSEGVYRSEEESCMSDNSAYFNAVSRQNIFFRVMGYDKNAGPEDIAKSRDAFLAFDASFVPEGKTKSSLYPGRRTEHLSEDLVIKR